MTRVGAARDRSPGQARFHFASPAEGCQQHLSINQYERVRFFMHLANVLGFTNDACPPKLFATWQTYTQARSSATEDEHAGNDDDVTGGRPTAGAVMGADMARPSFRAAGRRKTGRPMGGDRQVSRAPSSPARRQQWKASRVTRRTFPTPAYDLWREEVARGERTITTIDPLFRSACAESWALDLAEYPSIALGFRRDARRILKDALRKGAA